MSQLAATRTSFSSWGTRWRLTAFLLAALMFLALSVTTLILVRRTIVTDGRTHALNTTRAIARQFDAWLQKKADLLSQMGRMAADYQGRPKAFQRELATLLQSDGDLYDVYFWWAHGPSSIGSGWQPPASFDVRTRPWFIIGQDRSAHGVTDPYRDLHTGRMTITLSRPILSPAGEFVGVAALDLKLSAAARHVMLSHAEAGCRILVLDRGGQVMVDSRYHGRDYPEELAQLADAATSAELRAATRRAEEGFLYGRPPDTKSKKRWLITFTSVPYAGWTVVSYLPPETVLQPFALFMRGWLLISAATVIALLLLMLFFVDRLLMPIERLVRLTRGSRVMNTEAAASDDLLVLTRSVNRLMAYIEAFPGVLNLMLGLKDGYTSHHTREVAAYAIDIGKALGLSERQLGELECAALLHDIGKAGVPDVILKKPGALTEEEWTAIRLHPVIGAEVAAEAGFAPVITHAIRQHHERLDGSGYPDRRTGEAVSFYARIIAVADTYHAMTSDRPYRPARESAEAQAELCDGAGVKYDFRVVQAFLSVLAQGPKNGAEQAEKEVSISELSPA